MPDPEPTVRPGWPGCFFEDFEVGDRYEHPLGRTVLPTDNAWFTLLTQNTARRASTSAGRSSSPSPAR